MSQPRLAVHDPQGQRVVPIDKPVVTIGRRTSADLQIIGRDVSREHARISQDAGRYLIEDCGSRFGTFVNGQAISAPQALAHGDHIRLGSTEAVDIVFLSEADSSTGFRDAASDISDFTQMAAILNGLRALGSGRVLDEVLMLVLDSALEVTSAERGFVMLANAAGVLEFRVGRGKGGHPLTDASFETTSQKIPREVFESARSRLVTDLMDSGVAGAHLGTIATGIRHVLCVPLRVAHASGLADSVEGRTIGVLYLDGRERGKLISSTTQSSLEAFATQAALAIESARLYAEAAEKVRLERDLRVAADIQRALLPSPSWENATMDLAATTLPCRTVGGDFFDYLDLPNGDVGFTLGDVAGKGPPAALLAATVQSHFGAHAPVASDPADLMRRLNHALLRRAVEARFATMFCGVLSPSGVLQYSNAGQEPPLVVRAGGRAEWLGVGGPVLGLLPTASYEYASVSLDPGDLVVICSDGVTDAVNAKGEEHGRSRLATVLGGEHGADPNAAVELVTASVRQFAGTEPQADDITVMVIRHRG